MWGPGGTGVGRGTEFAGLRKHLLTGAPAVGVLVTSANGTTDTAQGGQMWRLLGTHSRCASWIAAN
jgi:hypothetical protein